MEKILLVFVAGAALVNRKQFHLLDISLFSVIQWQNFQGYNLGETTQLINVSSVFFFQMSSTL